MLNNVSYYKGHKGAVLSLTGDPTKNQFYSVGAEGLIVRWDLTKPNEGDVITRIPGLVPAIAYDSDGIIFSALNQKGILALDSKTGKKINSVPVPATSFNKIVLLDNYLIVSTKTAELIILEKNPLKLVFRIESGTDLAPLFTKASAKNTFWFNDAQGVHLMNVETQEIIKSVFEGLSGLTDMATIGNYLFTLQAQKVIAQDIHKKRTKPFEDQIPGLESARLKSDINAPAVLALLSDFSVITLNTDGKMIEYGSKSQILHNKPINDLLWCENYKFVLSASADKSIGVWRFN